MSAPFLVLAVSLLSASAWQPAFSMHGGYAGPGGIAECLVAGIDCATASAYGPALSVSAGATYGVWYKAGARAELIGIPGVKEVGLGAAAYAVGRIGRGFYVEAGAGYGLGWATRPLRIGTGRRTGHDHGWALSFESGLFIATNWAVTLRGSTVMAYPGFFFAGAGVSYAP